MAEFIVLTPELESMYKQLKRRIHRLQSGGTIDSIIGIGVDPGNQIGASFQALKNLAAAYDEDDKLARMLWADSKREEQIVAMFLFKNNLDAEQVVALLNNAVSYEVAEYAGSQWIANNIHVDDLLDKLFHEENEMVQIAMISASARLLMLKERGISEVSQVAEQYIVRTYSTHYAEMVARRYRFKYEKN